VFGRWHKLDSFTWSSAAAGCRRRPYARHFTRFGALCAADANAERFPVRYYRGDFLPSGEAGVYLRCRIELKSKDRTCFGVGGSPSDSEPSIIGIGDPCNDVAARGVRLDRRWDRGHAARVTGNRPRPDGTVISRESMYRWFGARLLSHAQVPELFAILTRVCGRAGLARVPELYCLPAPSDMNAYALGGPEHSAIVLTEGCCAA